MEYAIVDIETTGGHASGNGITEVSIHIHDGEKVIQRFETLINPDTAIPYYISGLTGITNEMVKNAPPFSVLAKLLWRTPQHKFLKLKSTFIFTQHITSNS